LHISEGVAMSQIDTKDPAYSETPKARPRQAVVLIHGIGEQRPMATLRGFVHALLPNGAYYSKPDEISDSFELRRLKLRRHAEDEAFVKDWPDTDFYEYYWAHEMHGTVISHIVSWLGAVMVRGWKAVRSGADDWYPPRLPSLVYATWALAIGVAAIALVSILYPVYCKQWRTCVELEFLDAAWIVLLLAVLHGFWSVLRPFAFGAVADFIGDAARYLDVNPKNVARRYDILRGGVAMLRKLHEDHDTDGHRIMYRYGRVVLVGHSLGSVIAYDILKAYFHEVNSKLPVEVNDFSAVENYCGSNGGPVFEGSAPYENAAVFWLRQREVWRRYARHTPAGISLPSSELSRGRWIVTDLVTMGSPLAYAPILLAENLGDIREKTAMRELPTCPPDRSHASNPGRFTVDVSMETERIHKSIVLQHHAFFAVTRWTNFYFERDPVGGALSPIFGSGIDDRCLDGPDLLRAHVSYWSLDEKGARPCVDAVRVILIEPVGQPEAAKVNAAARAGTPMT
jgi:hypothetical protein